jgi:hypothetical protein
MQNNMATARDMHLASGVMAMRNESMNPDVKYFIKKHKMCLQIMYEIQVSLIIALWLSAFSNIRGFSLAS